jgi:hypothetical protein
MKKWGFSHNNKSEQKKNSPADNATDIPSALILKLA